MYYLIFPHFSLSLTSYVHNELKHRQQKQKETKKERMETSWVLFRHVATDVLTHLRKMAAQIDATFMLVPEANQTRWTVVVSTARHPVCVNIFSVTTLFCGRPLNGTHEEIAAELCTLPGSLSQTMTKAGGVFNVIVCGNSEKSNTTFCVRHPHDSLPIYCSQEPNGLLVVSASLDILGEALTWIESPARCFSEIPPGYAVSLESGECLPLSANMALRPLGQYVVLDTPWAQLLASTLCRRNDFNTVELTRSDPQNSTFSRLCGFEHHCITYTDDDIAHALGKLATYALCQKMLVSMVICSLIADGLPSASSVTFLHYATMSTVPIYYNGVPSELLRGIHRGILPSQSCSFDHQVFSDARLMDSLIKCVDNQLRPYMRECPLRQLWNDVGHTLSIIMDCPLKDIHTKYNEVLLGKLKLSLCATYYFSKQVL